MQDTLDIAGAGYEYGFILLYTGYFILVQWKNTTQVYNSGVTDGGRLTKVQSSPWQAKCKNWAYIEIHIRTHFHFQTFFWMLARGPLRWPVCLFQLRFPPWLKPLATQLVYNIIFLNDVLLGYAKNAYNQRRFTKRHLHNSQLTKATADNEVIHNAFRGGWL